jgi:NTP pyrophosphatase (non-canonical NTP hydrolase)
MAKSIQDICDVIEKFSTDRGWANDDPNQLITSIFIELGELAEHYQWKDSFDRLPEDKTELGYEFVDIIFYLFRLANKSGIDLEYYFDEKVPKLEKKFPVHHTEEQHQTAKRHYRRTGKNKRYE